ncbi:hypothetical protein N658DRAFT_463272 [Parathielavia hyrcaniae]|uniref:Uncharacterized protein n=1 Tax=Parathielavia hyrcaniae TaxID=113614 RepID=A0AAN6QE02_9PEZI|nr:hypothetical protein N658DRAFT_463272 [Parathielavia hyrcaniae]
MDQTGPDWEANSWYKDSRQPPLAARLDTVVKFLAEEDVDRCLDWEAKFEEVVAYLEWLANQDDRHQLDNASPQTQAMFNDALNKAKAHVLFQEHHYNPTPLEIAKPRTSPLRSTRLNWMVGGQAWPLPSRTSSLPDRRTLLPRSAPPRTPGPVNRMLVDRPEDDHLYEQLAQDERQWWQPIAGNDLEHIPTNAENSQERNNMAYVEDRSFHSSAHGTNTGWIRTDPAGTGRPTSLPSGRALRPGSPKSWAMERGARRAGLQQALRALPTNPTTAELHTPWRRLVLPVPAATLRQACESADGPQWTPPSLDPSQLPEQLDPLQHTVDYRDRLRTIKMSRKVALMQVDAQHAGDPRWPALPPNLVNGGPFARPVLDAKAEARRDMLRLCRTTVAMLEAAYRRVPRPLLEAVLRMVREGAKGDEARLPEGVELAGDEWEQVGRERRPRYLDHEEVMWLKFLTGEYVNSKNWERRFVPDTPRDKYRLFLLFAQKVQKLLDDANPQGLFSRHDAEVEVEDLLAAINAGKDSSAVTKYEFQPHDACCWLDRLNKSGHVRFRLDVVCYGVVERPVAEYFPEHRVIWPTAGQLERPKQLEKHITDFGTVIQGRLGQPDVGEGSPVWNFFASLAFRLGYTISALEQTPADEPAPSPTAAARRLRDALTKWKQACADLQGTASPEPTAQELASIRTKIIDELSANEPMLHPARAAHHHSISSSSGTAALVRDHNWDWAALPVRGQSARRQYWSVDRWPLGTGHLSSSAERAVRQDEHLDRAVTYDAAAQDPTTDAKYLRPKLTPYQQEKTVYRRGPAVFALGDTRLQRERIERSMADMVENAMGLQRRPKRTWGDALTNLNPFSSPSSRAEDRKGEDWLPPVDPKLVPKSWGPVAEAEQQQQQDASEELESDTDSEEEFGEDFEIQSVDVAMTGMGESWMAD